MNNKGLEQKNSFDDIRIICCFIVIYEHCVALTNISYPILGLRDAAVNVFFILSGYWVTRSYMHADCLMTYVKKRFKKIFPMLWGVVITCALFFSVFSTLGLKAYFSSADLYKYIVCNGLTLNFLCQSLPGVFAGTYSNGAINGALWTLKIEIGFYLILPFLYHFYRKARNKKRILICMMLSTVLIQILIIFVVRHFSLPRVLEWQLPCYLPYFLFGMILSLDELIENFVIKSKGLFIICLLVFISGHMFNIRPFIFLEFISVGVIVFFMANNVHSFIGRRENLSYGMYLIHFPIIQMLAWLGFFNRYAFVGIGAAFCISYTIIRITNFLKEKCSR